jgi:hypothetical protein
VTGFAAGRQRSRSSHGPEADVVDFLKAGD